MYATAPVACTEVTVAVTTRLYGDAGERPVMVSAPPVVAEAHELVSEELM